MAEELASNPLTVIHGEYYPKNILVRAQTEIVPVDWESAAIGPGEIDLASLIEGWPEDSRAACRRAYLGARWDGGCPDEFERRLASARMYFALRWLGDASQHERPGQTQMLLALIREIALEAGVL
jgi:thiamine kinase-like enzyme